MNNDRAIEVLLERRLRERAARADCKFILTPEVVEQWIREELESIVKELSENRNRETMMESRIIN